MWKKSQTSEFQKGKSRKYTKTKKLNIQTCLYKGSQVQGSVNHLEADQKTLHKSEISERWKHTENPLERGEVWCVARNSVGAPARNLGTCALNICQKVVKRYAFSDCIRRESSSRQALCLEVVVTLWCMWEMIASHSDSQDRKRPVAESACSTAVFFASSKDVETFEILC